MAQILAVRVAESSVVNRDCVTNKKSGGKRHARVAVP